MAWVGLKSPIRGERTSGRIAHFYFGTIIYRYVPTRFDSFLRCERFASALVAAQLWGLRPGLLMEWRR